MKKELNPVLAGVVIVVVVAVIGFFVWRGANGGVGSLPPMAVGHPGPFSPGGAAVGKGGQAPPSNQASGMPGIPRN